MGYEEYGIHKELVERIKANLKNKMTKERVKAVLKDEPKADLQNEAKVRRLLNTVIRIMNEKLTDREKDSVVRFVIAQRIDPKNTFHLIKLWGMFR